MKDITMHASNRTTGRNRFLIPLFCMLFWGALPVHGLLIIQKGGAEPVKDRGWPKGVLKFANLPSRIAWRHLMGNFGWDSYTLQYQGDTAVFNSALKCFSAIRAPELRLQVRNGSGPVTDDKKKINWTFSPVNPRSYYQYHRFRQSGGAATVPPLEIVVFVGKEEPIKWDGVVVPDNIKVIDKRSSDSQTRPPGSGKLVVNVYEKYEGKPVEGARIFLFPRRPDKQVEKLPVFAADEDGLLEISDLPENQYNVHIEADGYMPFHAGSYHHNGRNLEIKHVYLGKAVTVSGTVIDTKGRPAAGVRLIPKEPKGIDYHPYPMVRKIEPVVTDNEGRFSITSVPEGSLILDIDRTSGWYRISSGDSPAPADDMRVMAGRTGTVKGHVVDREGQPIRGQSRVLLAQRGDVLDRIYEGAEIMEDGGFELTGIPAGEYLVGQNKGCLYEGTDPAAQVVLITEGGTETVRLQFPVSGRETTSKPHSPVQLAGKKAPPLQVASWLAGKATTLRALEGKNTVLVFMDAADKECGALLPSLEKTAQTGAAVIAVYSATDEQSALKALIRKHALTIRIAQDQPGERQRRGATFGAYGVRSLPALYLIDSRGIVRYQDLSPAALKRALDTLSRK